MPSYPPQKKRNVDFTAIQQKFAYSHSCLWPHLQPWASFLGPFVEGSFKKKAAKAAILERCNLDLARNILFPGGLEAG